MDEPREIIRNAARCCLGLLPRGVRVPILTGKLRGATWLVGSHNHSCWLGSYEAHTQRRLQLLVAKGDSAYDVGANAGFFTLLLARLVGNSGTVAAFEPDPGNLLTLNRHVKLNRLNNVTVLGLAISDRSGKASFVRSGAATGHLAPRSVASREVTGGGASIEVETSTLDELVQRGTLRSPDVLKIDVEGAELAVLRGAQWVLRTNRPKLLIELHTPEMDRACPEFLRTLGYEIEPFATWPGTTIPYGGFVAKPS